MMSSTIQFYMIKTIVVWIRGSYNKLAESRKLKAESECSG